MKGTREGYGGTKRGLCDMERLEFRIMRERTPLFSFHSSVMDSPPRPATNGTSLSKHPETNGSSSLSKHEFERQVAELLESQVNCQQQMFNDMKAVQSTIQQLKTVIDTMDIKTRHLQELVSNVTPKLHSLQDTLAQLVSEQQHLIPEVVSSVCNRTGDSIKDNDNSANEVQTIIEGFLKRVTDQMQSTVEEHHQALFKMLDTDQKLNMQQAPSPSPPPQQQRPSPRKPSWPSRMIVCPELSDDDDDWEGIQQDENSSQQQQPQSKVNNDDEEDAKKAFGRQVLYITLSLCIGMYINYESSMNHNTAGDPSSSSSTIPMTKKRKIRSDEEENDL